jgi:hypothetical protein
MEQTAKAVVTGVCEKYNTTGKGVEKLSPERLADNIEFCCKQPDYIKAVEDWTRLIDLISEKELEKA